MKKTIIFAALALIAVAACQKSQPTVIVDPDENIPEGTLIPILFGSNLAPVSTTTKSIGGVDAWKTTDTVHVFGITRTDSTATGTIDFAKGIEINDIAIPAFIAEGELIEVKDKNKKPYYYDLEKPYDFFGYYIDDAVSGVTEIDETTKTITIPVTIDGSQDVMLAVAERKATLNTKTGLPKTILANRLFSAYSARKEIHPALNFKHQLSRFKFIVSKGGDSATNVSIDSLAVVSPIKGVLTFKTKDNTITGKLEEASDATRETLYLPERDTNGKIIRDENSKIRPIENFVVSGNNMAVGESLMVIPGYSTYTLAFCLNQGEEHVWQKNLTIKIPGSTETTTALAEAGKLYTVHITVYNLESIKIEVGLEQWDEVDDVIEIGLDE